VKVSISALPILPETLEPAVKTAVSQAIAAVLYESVDGVDRPADLDMLMAELSNRVEDASEAPMDEWTLERRGAILYENDKVITVDIHNHGYLGGAHGFDERRILSFDTKDGHQLSLDEIMEPNSRSIFETIAEFEFRRVRNIPVGTSLAEAGFTVPAGETFAIPKNFGVVEGGILLYYNEYEIAAYSVGPTEVLLPKDAVASVLKAGSPQVAHLTALPSPELPAA